MATAPADRVVPGIKSCGVVGSMRAGMLRAPRGRTVEKEQEACTVTISRSNYGASYQEPPNVPKTGASHTAMTARSRGAARHRSLGRTWAGRVVATAVVIVALGSLFVGAFHGARQSSSMATAADARSWETDAAYWGCLDAQAHSLVAPGEHIWYDTHSLATWVTLEKVFAPWTVGVSERSQAEVWVSLRPARGRDQCLGTVVVGARPEGAHGRVVLRTGTGGSLPGRQPLPSTPE